MEELLMGVMKESSVSSLPSSVDWDVLSDMVGLRRKEESIGNNTFLYFSKSRKVSVKYLLESKVDRKVHAATVICKST